MPASASPSASTTAAAGRTSAVATTQAPPTTSATSGGPSAAQVEALQRVDVRDQPAERGRRAGTPSSSAGASGSMRS